MFHHFIIIYKLIQIIKKVKKNTPNKNKNILKYILLLNLGILINYYELLYYFNYLFY